MKSILTSDFFESAYALQSRFPIDFHTNYARESWQLVAYQYDLWLKRFQLQPIESPRHSSIPKIIHQIWIGGKMPTLYRRWGETWKQHHPDYQYILWTEKNINLGSSELRHAYAKTKNVGAKSDIVRYDILQRMGGIYCDTDLECISSIDNLIEGSSFLACSLFSSAPHFGNGFIASAPSHPIINSIINSIKGPILTTDVLEIIDTIGPGLLTEKCLHHIVSEEDASIALLPSNYCYPWPNYLRQDSSMPSKYLTHASFALHYWEMSWTKVSFFDLFARILTRIAKKVRKVT